MHTKQLPPKLLMKLLKILVIMKTVPNNQESKDTPLSKFYLRN